MRINRNVLIKKIIFFIQFLEIIYFLRKKKRSKKWN
jgi:hypothetical protein